MQMISKKIIAPCSIMLLAFSCSEKGTQSFISKEVNTVPPTITVLANLPDSSKPVRIPLKKPPRKIRAGKPEVRPISNPDTLGLPSFTNYSTEQGLALSSVLCGFRDEKGNLWLGTDGGGVSRYDGKSFTNFTIENGLAHVSVFGVYEDKKGNLWFGTEGGVSRYDGKSFTHFTIHAVSSIMEDNSGKLWFGTWGDGVSSYNDTAFTKYTTANGLAHNVVYNITKDRKGDLWFCTVGGASHYDGNSFNNFTTERGLINDFVTIVTEDKKGKVWFGTWGGGISCYDGKSFIHFTKAQGFINDSVVWITEDKTGDIWFGTKGGVSKYNGNSFTNFTTAQGLPHNSVNSITEDKTGNLWFGTWGGGVSCYNGKALTNFTVSQGLTDNNVWGIGEDKNGNLWFGTDDGGVSRYDGKSFANFTSAHGLTKGIIKSITKDTKGNLWFGSGGGGVIRYDGSSFTNFTTAQGLIDNSITSITEDKKGNIWFGTGGGVSLYDGRSFTNFTTAQGLIHNHIGSITEDRTGNIWFGTGGGVSLYDGRSFTNYTTAQGLINNGVFRIREDKKGNLWFGTKGGVSRFDGRSFTNFTTAHGLASNSVWGMVIDLQGNIFIGSNLGYSVLKGFKSLDPNSSSNEKIISAVNPLDNEKLKNYQPVFEIYNKGSGYPLTDLDAGSMFVDSKGIIWGGFSDRLVRFDYNAIVKNTEPPAVFIQSVKIHEENIAWNNLIKKRKTNPEFDSLANLTEEMAVFGRILYASERDSIQHKFSGIKFDSITPFYPIPQNLVIPYDHNNITFDFVAIEPARYVAVRYQYILEGYDEDWSPITKKTSATFGNIREGEYTFKLRARNPDGVWSEPITYTFKVLPPWHRTWLFRTIAFIFLVDIIYSIVRWRLRKKFELQLERSEKETQMAEMRQRTAELLQQKSELEMQALRSQMNPHFIFNSLNSINRFILQNNRTQASEYLTKFSKLVRLILQNSQASLISLESELEALELYLDLEALRFDHRFGYKISVPKDLDIEALQVPPLIIQPYTENAIWHGLMHKEDKGQLDIEVSEESDHLYFKISDNGIGRKQAAAMASKSATKHKSMGLRITQDRIAMLQKVNGESPVKIIDLEYADGSAAGTEVIIKMPLVYD